MGPKNQYTAYPREFDESDIDRTPEYEAFIEEIRKLQEERGHVSTHPSIRNLEPDLQRKKVDLFKLYKNIVERGGYSTVSNTTGLWKELAVQFNPPQHNTNIGFVLKTIYWRNLAAYECIHHWGKEAPKPEILEHVSAAGADLVGKTAPPAAAEPSTPGLLTRGRTGTEDAAAASSPSGRTLREAPLKRQFFQPPVQTPKPRNIQTPSQPSPTPQTIVNGKNSTPGNSSSNNSMVSFPPSNLPPLPPLVITPISTPYSNPQNFVQPAPAPPIPSVSQQLPANHSITDTHRASMSLASKVPMDVAWALRYLLDRSCHPQLQTLRLREEVPIGGYLLDLIAACVDAVNDGQVGKAAIPWKPSLYDPASKVDLTSYNKLAGTLETQEWVTMMEYGLHASEILRNLTTNPQNFPLIQENVRYLLQYRSDAFQILLGALRTPRDNRYVDLQTVCLQVLESVLRVVQHDQEAELVDLLWPIILDNNQTMVVSALNILVNLSMQGGVAYIENTPPNVLEHLGNLLMVPNEALLVPVLDFLYHYTLTAANVDALFSKNRAYEIVEQLGRLLSYGMVKISPPINSTPPRPEPRKPVPEVTPNIPNDLLDDILKLPEPQRAIWWMRSSFEANSQSEITQIALWQAYQQRFAGYISSGPKPQQMLIANDFIKNVSTAFPSAKPQMIKGENGQSNRFVINGIAPRESPMGLDFNTYLKCEWRVAVTNGTTQAAPSKGSTKACDDFFPSAAELFCHVRDNHTFLKKGSEITEQKCAFKTCTKFNTEPTRSKQDFFSHLLGHMPAKKKEPVIRYSNGEIHKPAPAIKKPQEVPILGHHPIPWTIELPARELPDSYGVYVMAAKVLLNISKVQSSGAGGLLLLKNRLAEKIASSRNQYLVSILCDIISNITQHSQRGAKDDVPMADGMDDSDGSPYPIAV
ncbi:Chromatin structure-remodeling complex protein rsc9 [Arthrobotrys musiformis]|uniref:Chromatin structure-remodeling complex protein rsc9 n=1 Tax=Arthrobotrys musiformis TaxID=47236 RepID=A0AAV9W6A8_9PEZI